jgi:replication-associated recombination protein RarA
MSFFETEEEVEPTQEHFIWAEKYRPKSFDEYLGNVDLKKSIQSYLDQNEIPNMLLHSRSPGTGKTSLAKLLTSKIDCDVLYMNAADESRIDDVRIKCSTSIIEYHGNYCVTHKIYSYV